MMVFALKIMTLWYPVLVNGARDWLVNFLPDRNEMLLNVIFFLKFCVWNYIFPKRNSYYSFKRKKR